MGKNYFINLIVLFQCNTKHLKECWSWAIIICNFNFLQQVLQELAILLHMFQLNPVHFWQFLNMNTEAKLVLSKRPTQRPCPPHTIWNKNLTTIKLNILNSSLWYLKNLIDFCLSNMGFKKPFLCILLHF